MKKVWGYIAVFMMGALSIALLAWKFIGDTYKIGINKLKQKGKGNRLDSELDVNMPVKSRLDRRLERKQGRIVKRNLRKEKKTIKQLNKNS